VFRNDALSEAPRTVIGRAFLVPAICRWLARNVSATRERQNLGIAVNRTLNVGRDGVVVPAWFASPRTALWLGVATVLSMVAAVVESSLGAKGGLWAFLVPFVVVGALVARRQPGNPIGPILLLLTFAIVAANDAEEYDLLRYRSGYHRLPVGPVAVFLGTPGPWMWLVVLLPLPIALFPDGRLTPRWRRMLWGYLGVCAIFVGINSWQAVAGIRAGHIRVNSQGQLASTPATPGGNLVAALVVAAYLGFCLAWVLRLLLAYRRSSGDYRQQLKWLAMGGALCITGLVLVTGLSQTGSRVLQIIGGAGLLISLFALPVSLGVAILRYRLYEIDRLISRTISYLIVTGLLAGTFVGIVVVATDVLPFSSPVGVAASTLAAAALFNPLRSRVQRIIDRRFNRSRYDAETIVARFTLRLRQAVDLDSVRGELLGAVDGTVQPSHASLWVRPTTERTSG
jgi:hypothetical protein